MWLALGGNDRKPVRRLGAQIFRMGKMQTSDHGLRNLRLLKAGWIFVTICLALICGSCTPIRKVVAINGTDSPLLFFVGSSKKGQWIAPGKQRDLEISAGQSPDDLVERSNLTLRVLQSQDRMLYELPANYYDYAVLDWYAEDKSNDGVHIYLLFTTNAAYYVPAKYRKTWRDNLGEITKLVYPGPRVQRQMRYGANVYVAPAMNSNAVATIRDYYVSAKSAQSFACVTHVDGKMLPPSMKDLPRVVALAPGKRALSVSAKSRDHEAKAVLELDARAGSHYELRFGIHAKLFTKTTFDFWLVDAETGAALSTVETVPAKYTAPDTFIYIPLPTPPKH